MRQKKGEVAVEYALTLDGLVHDISMCPKGTWICRTERTYGVQKPTTYVSIAGKAQPGLGSSEIRLIEPALDRDNSSFGLLLGGLTEDKPPSYVSIYFICSMKTAQLVFTGYDSERGVYSFSWTTPHACPIDAETQLSSLTDGEGGSEDPSPEDTGDSGEDGELIDPGTHSTARRKFAAIVFLVVTAAILISALFTIPNIHDKAKRVFEYLSESLCPSAIIQDLHLRVDENQLVRWAQEDLVFAEEDMMVNGSRWSWDREAGLDEYIPLKPNPGTARGYFHPNRPVANSRALVKDYGTAIMNRGS